MIHDLPLVTAVYARAADAARAIHGLEKRGFLEPDISILLPEGRGLERELVGFGVLSALMAGLHAAGSIATAGGVGVLLAGPMLGAIVVYARGESHGAAGLVRALTGYGIADYDAELFAREVHCGKVLVAVRSAEPESLDTAERVLANAGAETTSRA